MKQSKYKTLVDEFASDIRNGKLPPGTQLPTHRKLAAQQGIALVSASKVYTQLEKMGLVSGETGRGTFVRETSIPFNHGIDQQPIAEDVIDLNFNSPALPNQTNLLRDALKKLASSGDLATLLHYQPHTGRKHERAIIAKHLQCRALNVSSDQIAITSGAQHGLACTVISLLKPGDVVAVDSLIYPGFKLLADVHCLELVAIPFSKKGPDLNALSRLCNQRNVKAIYAMPTLHNPMGWVLDIKWRKQLVNIAREHQLLIIEDAAYAFHAESPPPPLASLAPELTVYVSGFSKSIATGLRVGFVALPLKWTAKIERTIRATVWNTPALMTTIACKWIEDKTIAKLEREKRNDAKKRQNIARLIFKKFDFISHENAYFIWLPLPVEVRSDHIVSQLLKDKISVSTAKPFATTEHVPHALRIALGSVDISELEQALHKIKHCIENYAY